DITISFEGEKRDLRKWTLILGENGTGKSNLLKAIALITAGSNGLGELLGNVDSWIQNGASFLRIDATLQNKKKEERQLSLIINRGDTLSKIISTNQETLHLIDEALEYTERSYFVVAYGASRRLSSGEAPRNMDKSYRYINVRNLFDGSAALNPLTSWAMELDYRSGKKGLRIVADTLNDFLPGTTFSHIDKSRKQLIFKTVDGDVPLEQLSDGYQNMAAWIGDLLFRVTESFKDYVKPMESRGLLLIDEIDLHLHPKWQRQLMEFISNKLPNFQVIATTHSPLTAQQAGEGELFALKRNAQNMVELVPFIGAPRQLLVNQLLMTPAFGLETDESYFIENQKKRYRSIDKKSMTKAEKAELEKIKEGLADRVVQRSNSLLSVSDKQLLKEIKEAVSKN
ncbi:MAG: ATP-binding protein, partial [Saprospiraceae bacterium]|nr:ATP-binding protein [Saprospiraceae bacterium]